MCSASKLNTRAAIQVYEPRAAAVYISTLADKSLGNQGVECMQTSGPSLRPGQSISEQLKTYRVCTTLLDCNIKKGDIELNKALVFAICTVSILLQEDAKLLKMTEREA